MRFRRRERSPTGVLCEPSTNAGRAQIDRSPKVRDIEGRLSRPEQVTHAEQIAPKRRNSAPTSAFASGDAHVVHRRGRLELGRGGRRAVDLRDHAPVMPTGQRWKRRRPNRIAFSEPSGIQIVVNRWPSRQRTGRSKPSSIPSIPSIPAVARPAKINNAVLSSGERLKLPRCSQARGELTSPSPRRMLIRQLKTYYVFICSASCKVWNDRYDTGRINNGWLVCGGLGGAWRACL